jgi:hypothetical protein
LTSKGKCRLGPERIEGITGMPLSETRTELQKFPGLSGYCRLWIESYALRTKTFLPNFWKRNLILYVGSQRKSR